MKWRLPRRRIWRLAIYLACLLAVALALDVLLAQSRREIHPGLMTTRIVAPVREDGAVDYLLALDGQFGEGVTPENNAAPLILQALGRAGLPKNQPPDGITQRLGMGHLSEEGDYFVSYDEFYKGKPIPREFDPGEVDGGPNWPVTVSESTRQWLRKNEKPLELIVEASKRPRYFLPFYGGRRLETLIEVQLPDLRLFKDTCRALLVRAALRLEAGDGAGFESDVLAVHHLARLLAQSPTLVQRNVAIVMETSACRTDRLAASSGKLPPGGLAKLEGELAAMDELPPIADGLNLGERFLVLDTVQALARANPVRAGKLLAEITGPGGSSVPPFLFPFLPIPYEESMREMNHLYDGALAALGQPTYRQRMSLLRMWEDEAAHLAPRNRALSLLSPQWAVGIFLPSMIRVTQKDETARMELRLTRIAVALAIYQAEQGAYPQRLNGLTPKYLRAVPADLFSDGALVYRPSGKGYTLYSVGANMIDDQGGKDDVNASVK